MRTDIIYDDACIACDSMTINMTLGQGGVAFYKCLECGYTWDSETEDEVYV